MTGCEHNWSRAGQRWATYDTCFWICVTSFDVAEFGRCRRLSTDGYRHCMARHTACTTDFPRTLAAQRWAACDDLATLRERGQQYEHAWVKALARELDLMIEIQQLRRQLAAATQGTEQ